MRYEQIWNAVDKLAKQNGLSPSGLAKKAGLDSTTFNKSKRVRADGKKRWPSLDSINKVLEVCNLSFEEFYKLTKENTASKEIELTNPIPYAKYSSLKKLEKIEKSIIDTSSWKKVSFPDSAENLYAIDIDVVKFAPIYRFGSVLIASKNSEIRRGDRIIIINNSGEIMINEFLKRTAGSIILADLTDSSKEQEVLIKNIKLINRIVWASQ